MTNLPAVSIHAGGIECIQFANPLQIHIDAVGREFGGNVLAPPKSLGSPLVRVRFDETQPSADATYVGRTNAITDGILYCCEGSQWAAIPFKDLLDPDRIFEVQCSPGFDMVRLIGYLLEPVAKVRALLAGHCFVHSSTIDYQGRAILLSAWGNTGKTNLLLHFSRGGSGMLADDWSLLLSDGRVAGYPRPVNLMNYNLDTFPHLLEHLSVKQRLLYRVDQCFRRIRPWFSSRGGILLRISDGVERVLETLSNCRIPLGEFENSGDGAMPAAAVIELHKLRRGASPEVGEISVENAARMATVCFGFENGRLMQRLAELSYGCPSYDELPDKILALYNSTFQANLKKAAGDKISSIGMPSRPDSEELLATAKIVESLATQ